jgi:hypothetical protein
MAGAPLQLASGSLGSLPPLLRARSPSPPVFLSRGSLLGAPIAVPHLFLAPLRRSAPGAQAPSARRALPSAACSAVPQLGFSSAASSPSHSFLPKVLARPCPALLAPVAPCSRRCRSFWMPGAQL